MVYLSLFKLYIYIARFENNAIIVMIALFDFYLNNIIKK